MTPFPGGLQPSRPVADIMIGEAVPPWVCNETVGSRVEGTVTGRVRRESNHHQRMFEGTLVLGCLEGPHFELETVVDGTRRVYVLIPLDAEVEKTLAAGVGRHLRVTGILHEGPSIFMRGPVVRVTEVRPA